MTDIRPSSLDVAGEYRTGLATDDNRAMPNAADARARLAAFPRRLAEAAQRAPSERPAPGEWTPPEIVRHLIAVEEEVWHVRLGQLATEEHPHWRWTEPGQWLGAPGASLDEVLATHAAARARTLAMLDGLGETGWARTGTHDTFGDLDVAALMTVAADHDDEHLASLGGTPTAAD
jgi:DinB superfamily